MARRYDQVGAAFRAVYEALTTRAPRPPELVQMADQVGSDPSTGAAEARPLVVVVVALLILGAVGVVALLAGRAGPNGSVPPTVPVGSETTVASTSEPGSTVDTSATTTTSPLLARPAPWSGAPLAAADVDPVLRAAWSAAGNRRWCSLLAPADLGAEGQGAEARKADFGSNGWGVSWDRPDGPGLRAEGTPCEDCGRSAFGVAGTDLVATPEDVTVGPSVLEWSDGSAASFGNEGNAADTEFVDPETGSQVAPRQLAYVMVAGEACLYNAWSSLGPTHMESFLAQLRYVEGNQAEPVEVRRPGDPPQVVVDGGDPPWEQAAIPESAVPSLLASNWSGSGSDVRLIWVDGLEAELPSAEIRAANLGEWAVAWNNPDGPGHDSGNLPCADCGRGVVGLAGGVSASELSTDFVPYGRVDWADGSLALYDLRLGSMGLPPDRIIHRDATTGEEVSDGWEARISIAGLDSMYVVWTHLGEEDLLDLLNRIRFVD